MLLEMVKMISDGFKQRTALQYLEHDLERFNIPRAEFLNLYQRLDSLSELKDLELLLLQQRMSYDKLDYIPPTGNIHLTAGYDPSLGTLEEMSVLISKKTGLAFDTLQHWVGQDDRGSFLYRFPDGENIARIVLTSYSGDKYC